VSDQVEDAANQLEPHDAVTVEDAADQVEPRAAAAIVDVFVYVVVLNLFVEYLPQVLSETFTLTLLTAVLLKVISAAISSGAGRLPVSSSDSSRSQKMSRDAVQDVRGVAWTAARHPDWRLRHRWHGCVRPQNRRRAHGSALPSARAR